VRPVKNPEDFKRDLEVASAKYHEARDGTAKREALVMLLAALEHFATAAVEGASETLGPVRQLCKELGDLNNGRRCEIFAPSPRKGKRPPRYTDIQAQARAAAYMHLKMPQADKETAAREAARKFGFDAKSVDYWRERAIEGNANGPWTHLFRTILQIVTAKFPHSSDQQARAVLSAHKRGRR
jgi:hypothetical protein